MKIKILFFAASLVASPFLRADVSLDSVVCRPGEGYPRAQINRACSSLSEQDSDALSDAYNAYYDSIRFSHIPADKRQAIEADLLAGKTARQIILEGSLLQLRVLRQDDLTRSDSDAERSRKIAVFSERLVRYAKPLASVADTGPAGAVALDKK